MLWTCDEHRRGLSAECVQVFIVLGKDCLLNDFGVPAPSAGFSQDERKGNKRHDEKTKNEKQVGRLAFKCHLVNLVDG